MTNLNSLKSAELITLALAGNEVAKAEIQRRHDNRVTKGKKPIPAIAKFLGLAPATPAKLKAPKAKSKPMTEAEFLAKPKIDTNDLTDEQLVEKYSKSGAAFLKNMLIKTKDPRKKAAQLVALNAKTSAGSVSTPNKVQESVKINKKLAGIIKALSDLNPADKALVVAALAV